jgi:hypothetical protein
MDAELFACEYMWVVLNSGLKNQVAAKIWVRVCNALRDGLPVNSAFHHTGKSAAMQDVWDHKERYFDEWKSACHKVAYLQTLSWIGPVTKWHLAKNLGLDVCKPDRHMTRLAKAANTTPDELCRDLALATGDTVHTVDLVLWRACNLGLLKPAADAARYHNA